MNKSLLISKSVLIILTICEEFIFGISSVKPPLPMLKIGKFKDSSKMVISSQERKSKIYVPVLTLIGSFHVQSLESFKIESEILESRPKESGKSCHLKISREFKILIQLSTQIFEQIGENFKKFRFL